MSSAMSTLLTFLPCGGVCGVFSIMPMIASLLARTSSMFLASFTPPPLPRPPAWICAFTTHHLVPVSWLKSLGLIDGLIGVVGHQATLDADAVLGKDGFALVLVQVHRVLYGLFVCLHGPEGAANVHAMAGTPEPHGAA